LDQKICNVLISVQNFKPCIYERKIEGYFMTQPGSIYSVCHRNIWSCDSTKSNILNNSLQYSTPFEPICRTVLRYCSFLLLQPCIEMSTLFVTYFDLIFTCSLLTSIISLICSLLLLFTQNVIIRSVWTSSFSNPIFSCISI